MRQVRARRDAQIHVLTILGVATTWRLAVWALGAAATTLLARAADGQRWLPVGVTTSKDTIAIDDSTVATSPLGWRAWVRTVGPSTQSAVRIEVDCAGRRYRDVAAVILSPNSSMPVPVTDTSWREPYPQSTTETIVPMICNMGRANQMSDSLSHILGRANWAVLMVIRGQTAMWYDVNSLRRTGNRRYRVWTRDSLSQTRLTEYEYDCASQQERMGSIYDLAMHWVVYDSAGSWTAGLSIPSGLGRTPCATLEGVPHR